MKIFGKNFDYSNNKIYVESKEVIGNVEDKKESIAENINEKLENYKRNIKKQK